jgi:hypothetical protein
MLLTREASPITTRAPHARRGGTYGQTLCSSGIQPPPSPEMSLLVVAAPPAEPADIATATSCIRQTGTGTVVATCAGVGGMRRRTSPPRARRAPKESTRRRTNLPPARRAVTTASLRSTVNMCCLNSRAPYTVCIHLVVCGVYTSCRMRCVYILSYAVCIHLVVCGVYTSCRMRCVYILSYAVCIHLVV